MVCHEILQQEWQDDVGASCFEKEREEFYGKILNGCCEVEIYFRENLENIVRTVYRYVNYDLRFVLNSSQNDLRIVISDNLLLKWKQVTEVW